MKRLFACVPHGKALLTTLASSPSTLLVSSPRRVSTRNTSVTPLPQVKQVLPHIVSNEWESSSRAHKGNPTPAMPDLRRSEEHRRRVADWKPIVKVAQDARLRVAIVGRPNAGKSSLFNALSVEHVGPKRDQVVKNTEGMTRDAVESLARLDDMDFTVIDTPGLIGGKLVEEAMNTLATADAAIIVAGADTDISQEERQLAAFLSARRVPTFLVVNKADLIPEDNYDAVLEEFTALGVGNAIPISLHRKDGLESIAAAIRPLFHVHTMRRIENEWAIEDLAMEGDEGAMEEVRDRNTTDRSIRIAIIGRTQSGKSSLLNRLVGFERSRAADEADTTRDAIEIPCTYKGRKLCLIDTAGFKRIKSRRYSEFHSEIYQQSMAAVRFADVVIVVFDATEGHPSNFDMSLLHMAKDEGRPFIIAANKWDAVLDPGATAEAIDFKVKRQDEEIQYTTAVVCSAASALNLTLLLDQTLEHYDRWNKKIRTSDLTRFWRRFEKSVIIPTRTSRVGRLVQSKARPPTFILQLQTKDDGERFDTSMERMVKNALTEEFNLKGVPIRLIQDFKDSHPDFI